MPTCQIIKRDTVICGAPAVDDDTYSLTLSDVGMAIQFWICEFHVQVWEGISILDDAGFKEEP
jgi:hypothetical protein|tara:strand:+ start:896 stop:1084 length:189 start_codon:yes stop_codon:yes gene_type:complete